MKNYAVLADLRVKTGLHIEKAFDRGYEQGYNDCKVELTDDEAKCHYQEGYNDGYRKGVERRKEACVAEADCAYQCGMKRAWEAAKKVVETVPWGGLSADESEAIFGETSFQVILQKFSAQEVIAKLEAWEKKQERYCYNCGQPRDYKNSCIPYKEGKCDKSHKAWIPKQDAPEMNVGSIAVWDEVEDNLGNQTVVTHIYSDGKDANADVINADGSFRCMPLELLEKTGRRFCFQELLNAMKKDDVEEAETNEDN
jgi:hypothetical protein